jgi:hypothetical protein
MGWIDARRQRPAARAIGVSRAFACVLNKHPPARGCPLFFLHRPAPRSVVCPVRGRIKHIRGTGVPGTKHRAAGRRPRGGAGIGRRMRPREKSGPRQRLTRILTSANSFPMPQTLRHCPSARGNGSEISRSPPIPHMAIATHVSRTPLQENNSVRKAHLGRLRAIAPLVQTISRNALMTS